MADPPLDPSYIEARVNCCSDLQAENVSFDTQGAAKDRAREEHNKRRAREEHSKHRAREEHGKHRGRRMRQRYQRLVAQPIATTTAMASNPAATGRASILGLAA